MITVDPEFIDQLADTIADRVADRLRKPEAEVVPQPLLVGGDDLAHLIGISRPMIDRLRRENVIPSVMIGARRLYDPNDVVAALKNQTP